MSEDASILIEDRPVEATPSRYRRLEPGEKIFAGDEWQRGSDLSWYPVSAGTVGCAVRDDIPFRRLVQGLGFGPHAGLSRYSPLGEALAEIEGAHAACDDLVSRAGADGPRPLAERVSAIRQMLTEAWRDHAATLDGIPKQPALSATGEFPEDDINPEDEGELQLAIGHDDENVRIEFGKQVAWLAMPRADAVEFARAVMRHAVQLRE